VVGFPDADGEPQVDVAASDALRAELRAGRPDREPFVDRGPGYARLSPDGSASNEFDWL
jgi:N-methylhydantoinase B